MVVDFKEKPLGDGGWINGGFFVLEPAIFSFINDDQTIWETNALVKIAKQNQLAAYRHDGFWHPMDTLRDKQKLMDLWDSKNAPWKVW